ncbi:ATP-binding protein [Rhodoferax sp. TS-BS-61-7]|uniref:ATP-binding protein n=1 Tax=Rhodoferax sp. TS-BS-61-7 TaxID=2094194 RepID=UPI000CF73C3C|nr:ATP-binding protein [Rhodoferax sp. TS-BS-61-7]PQA75947.1 AAA family ATPase [Rhodoferax sp. TS-BS-61-7]
MFHLQSLELLHWDYCQRLTLPLDGTIITVAGPNGSGKTTLLDAMRTLLGLDCSGGRSYKTYARHANADSAWLRATVDNRSTGRQASNRPFARCLLYTDQVTLVCRIERNGGDWQRRYCMVEGDVSIETLVQMPEKDWLGIEHWRRRLEGAGLSRAIARVLALEQGQTDRLCEYSPKELLRLVFDVFGDQEVLDRYEEARKHQSDVDSEVETSKRDLAHAEAQLAQLDARVNLYRQYQDKLREQEKLWTEVIPVLEWSEERKELAIKLQELHRQRLQHAASTRQQKEDRQKLLKLSQELQGAGGDVRQLDVDRQIAMAALNEATAHEKPVEKIAKEAEELHELAKVESNSDQLADRIKELEARKSSLEEQWHTQSGDRRSAQGALDKLQNERQAPPPEDVTRFRRVLRAEGIEHHLLADIVDITDPHWRAAAEGVLRGSRWVVILKNSGDEARALAFAERERYRHYVVTDAVRAPATPASHSLLAVLKISETAPSWLIKQLGQIRRVENTAEGGQVGGEWITPLAYWRDGRGGRSVWVDPEHYQFGAAAIGARRESLQRRLADLDGKLQLVATAQSENQRQLKAAQDATKGHRAAEELVRRGDEFEQARRQLPQVRQARIAAGARWTQLDRDFQTATAKERGLQADYNVTQTRLRDNESAAAKYERDWNGRRTELSERSTRSRAKKSQFPVRWIRSDIVQGLRAQFSNATQARLRGDAIKRELEQGAWEMDASVEERHTLMVGSVNVQKLQLQQREASNEAARAAVGNARERYIDVLRSTIRRYRKNIVELGQLAGVEVSADLPHLDNDDTVLRQAELKVNFNFDGKGQIGLNDGEASGGQQVIKSLILLVGLLKDDDNSGGFVFIDEPFAHLDVRNIQLVGHFLKSTRAQYVLTTPITHNVEVFEPADVTLVTSKKLPGARWAPPIGVLQRRAATH